MIIVHGMLWQSEFYKPIFSFSTSKFQEVDEHA